MQQPITRSRSLEDASASLLAKQLRWEIEQIKIVHSLTNEELADKLQYKPGAIGKWTSGAATVSAPGAAALDKAGYEPIGPAETFTHLHACYRTAKASSARTRRLLAHDHDVFLASPMAATADEKAYNTEREAALELKHAIETWCKLSVFYAGDGVESREHFGPAELAADYNFKVLRDARFFVLVALTKLKGPSTVYVEAGYALATGIPALYITPKSSDLPFILRKLGENPKRDILAPVSLQYCTSVREATSLIKNYGPALFERLGDSSQDAPLPRR